MSKIGNAMLTMCENAIAEAALVAERHDPARVAVFAPNLRGMGNMKVAEALTLVPGLRVPGDFRHARYTRFEVVARGSNGQLVLGEGLYGGEIVCPSQAPLTMADIIAHALVISGEENCTSNGQGEWVETVALPIIDEGTLELGLVLVPRGTNDWIIGTAEHTRTM
ncbi:MAG: hypothetical protein GW854_07060 [Erythrobacter sp.]|nr:hypothetical protein [Erythrobacter sp.]